MNKSMIILLAICFVGCAHAFAKREATEKPAFDWQKELEQLQKSIQSGLANAQDSVSKSFESIKSQIPKIDSDDVAKKVKETLDTIEASLKAKPAEAKN